jgi:hypothetical protein
MFAAQQFGKDVPGCLVVADQLPARPAIARADAWPARSAARPSPGPRSSCGTSPDRECVDDLAPWRQPALVRRVRVEQHPQAHAMQRLQARVNAGWLAS